MTSLHIEFLSRLLLHERPTRLTFAFALWEWKVEETPLPYPPGLLSPLLICAICNVSTRNFEPGSQAYIGISLK